jgi:preprotein translocase subunit SecF
MMARITDIPGRLYRGDVSINFVGRQRLWYAISGLILLVSIVSLLTRGLNFSEDFTGGANFQFPATSSTTQTAISRVVETAGGGSATVQHVSGGLAHSAWTVQTKTLSPQVSEQVTSAIEKAFGIQPNQMSVSFVGATWGSQISSKATEALIIFLVVIVIYLTIAFEWKMAIAAFVALIHDIVITTGVYSLAGFQVAPASVIGLLTILGYSLYDTVVVFDKVRENTAGLLTSQRSTYSQAANLALNQTLIRSINTSLTALLPVASILFIGGALLSAGTLNDLSLVLFVGMLSGTYSSIFIATPVLADLKEREPAYKDLAAKIARRAVGGRAAQRAAAATVATAGVAATTSGSGATARADAADVDEPDDPADRRDDTPESTGDAVTVPAGQPTGAPGTSGASGAPGSAARPGADGTRPVSRQQPRRGGSAQRRPGPRKKRR